MVKNRNDDRGITSSSTKDFVEKHPETLSFVLLQVTILVKTKLGGQFWHEKMVLDKGKGKVRPSGHAQGIVKK